MAYHEKQGLVIIKPSKTRGNPVVIPEIYWTAKSLSCLVRLLSNGTRVNEEMMVTISNIFFM
jgi:hypothetical protein